MYLIGLTKIHPIVIVQLTALTIYLNFWSKFIGDLSCIPQYLNTFESFDIIV